MLENNIQNICGMFSYAKVKIYTNESDEGTTIKNSGAVSSLIWGSQWDAMLNWIQESGLNVASETEGEEKRNESLITGNEKYKDKINNIYDLFECNREWTLEASNINSRVSRGGSSVYNLALSYRNYTSNPTSAVTNYSGRITLYIK